MVISEGERFVFDLTNFNRVVGLVEFANFNIDDAIEKIEQFYKEKALLWADSLATEVSLAYFSEYMPKISLGLKNECR